MHQCVARYALSDVKWGSLVESAAIALARSKHFFASPALDLEFRHVARRPKVSEEQCTSPARLAGAVANLKSRGPSTTVVQGRNLAMTQADRGLRQKKSTIRYFR